MGTMSRLVWVDAGKGVGIFLVVLGHALRGLHEAGLFDPGLFAAIDSRIYAFHMPLFFVLSGVFFLAALRRTTVPEFLGGRLRRLLYPMILWTYVFIAFKLLAGSLGNTPLSADDLTALPVPGRWHFWFLWALFLIQVALLAIRPLLGRVPDGLLLAGLLAAALALRAVPFPGPAMAWAGTAIQHLPFFVLGMLLGLYRDAFARHLGSSAGLALAGLAVFALLVATAPAWGASAGPALPVVQALTCLALLVPLAWMGAAGPGAALAVLGAASLPIFLAHTIFSAGLREALLLAGLAGPGLHLLLGTLIGLAGPYLLLRLAQRWRVTGWLGF